MTLPIDLQKNSDASPQAEPVSDLNAPPSLKGNPDFERYFLHFGVKAAAGAVFASELLTELEHGTGDISSLIIKYGIKGDPLTFSMEPVVTELGLPVEALEISRLFWGNFAADEVDRISIISADFISPLGFGISGWVGDIPAEIFRKNWELIDLYKIRQVGAILLVNQEVWSRCLTRLERIGEGPLALSSQAIGLIERVDQVIKDVSSGAIRQHSISFGHKYLESISLKTRPESSPIKKESNEAWLARLKSEMEEQKRLDELTPPKKIISEPSPSPVDLKISPNREVDPLTKSSAGVRPTVKKNNSAKSRKSENQEGVSSPIKQRPVDPGALRDEFGKVVENPAMFKDEDGSRYKALLNSQSQCYELKRQIVGIWEKGSLQGLSPLHEIESLKARLEAAYAQDCYALVQLKAGTTCEGLVVYGARRADFFTLINEKAESTIYPRLMDVIKIEFFKEIIYRKT